jgi:hypothetical protein
MPPRSREERLFGAACLKLTVSGSAHETTASEIYEATLRDLGLTDEDVIEYLREHEADVRAALAKRRSPKN